MKKHSILIAALVASIFSVQAQITITKDNLVRAGQEIVQAHDTVSSKTLLQTGGTNKTWDLSTLSKNYLDTSFIGLKAWFPGSSNFPTATHGVTSRGDSSVTFLQLDNSTFSILGQFDYSFGGGVGNFYTRLISLPSTYGTKYKDSSFEKGESFPLGIDPDGPGPLKKIDSLRVDVTTVTKSNIIGWGSMKTPLGTYNSLMQEQVTLTAGTYYMRTGTTWSKISNVVLALIGFDNTVDTSLTHLWWTDAPGVGFPLVVYDFVPGDKYTSEVSWIPTNPFKSGVAEPTTSRLTIHPSPVQDVLHINLSNTTLADIEIITLQGQSVMKTTSTGTGSLLVTELPAGIYILKAVDHNTGLPLGSEKFMKN
jgi:hypothetical protein